MLGGRAGAGGSRSAETAAAAALRDLLAGADGGPDSSASAKVREGASSAARAGFLVQTPSTEDIERLLLQKRKALALKKVERYLAKPNPAAGEDGDQAAAAEEQQRQQDMLGAMISGQKG